MTVTARLRTGGALLGGHIDRAADRAGVPHQQECGAVHPGHRHHDVVVAVPETGAAAVERVVGRPHGDQW